MIVGYLNVIGIAIDIAEADAPLIINDLSIGKGFYHWKNVNCHVTVVNCFNLSGEN
jgi:hypothetical protein